MKIFLANFQGTGVGYFRHWLPAAALKARGHEVIYFPESGDALTHINKITKGHQAEWFEKHLPSIDIIHTGYSTNESHIRLLATAREYAAFKLGRNIPLITDIDDDIINVPSYNAAFGYYHGASTQRKIAKFHLQISDAVTTSTAPLMEVLRPMAKRIYHLPNCFNSSDWEQFPTDPSRDLDKSVRLIFNGGPSRVADYDTLQGVIESLMERYNGDGAPLLRLFFLGCAPKWITPWLQDKTNPLANRAFYIHSSDIEDYWATLRWLRPNILVNPLVCNTFNASKSSIKAWDAILAHAAYVGTDWATHDDIPATVMHKCVSPLQWNETLSYLIENADARAKSAERLSAWGLENMAIEHHINRWESVYEECVKIPVIRRLEETITVGG